MPGFEAFFVPAVSENLLCRICHLPVRRAVQVSVCGHRFCDSCLNGALRTQRSGRLRCPVDSSSIDFSQVYADDVTNQMIMSLTVYCDHYQGGCKWKGALKKLQDHLKECKHVPVSCPNGCGSMVARRKTADHVKKDCVKRRVTCSRCRREMLFEDIQSHSCPTNRPSPSEDFAPCSNGCGARVKRREMARHLRTDCSSRWIFCERCGVEIVYRDRLDHQRTCRSTSARARELIRGGKRSSVTTAVRFDSRSMRSNSTTQNAPEQNAAPPWRSVSFPASLNYIGREEFGSQVIYRGSSRSGESGPGNEDWDIFTCSCGERISRRQITNHMSDECPKRMTRCQYCHVQSMYEEMQNHLQVCTRFPLSCPNNCGVSQIPREEMDRHIAHSCRSNVVNCPFKHAGCNHECPSTGIQRHLEEDVKNHLSLVSEIAIKQQKELNELRELVRHCRPFGHGKLLWKLDEFRARFQDGKKTKGVEVHSPPFYTSPCGYKFKVVVFPYGNGSGEGSHLSVYIRLLPGEYDALLKWPFEGEITLSLLDQSSDTRHRRHITQSFSPDPNWKSFQRPTKTTNTLGFGYPQYVSHRGLESSSYVKENCLFIKATVDCKHSVDI